MLTEIEVKNPVKSWYIAKVYVDADRRKEIVSIPFPERRKLEKDCPFCAIHREAGYQVTTCEDCCGTGKIK